MRAERDETDGKWDQVGQKELDWVCVYGGERKRRGELVVLLVKARVHRGRVKPSVRVVEEDLVNQQESAELEKLLLLRGEFAVVAHAVPTVGPLPDEGEEDDVGQHEEQVQQRHARDLLQLCRADRLVGLDLEVGQPARVAPLEGKQQEPVHEEQTCKQEPDHDPKAMEQERVLPAKDARQESHVPLPVWLLHRAEQRRHHPCDGRVPHHRDRHEEKTDGRSRLARLLGDARPHVDRGLRARGVERAKGLVTHHGCLREATTARRRVGPQRERDGRDDEELHHVAEQVHGAHRLRHGCTHRRLHVEKRV
mmetsp:Transcript_14078/g.35764  ORF Transcript_14078/g.35764 Transcript_14078/m.35764 type:complete len:309 (+) Transcript_14078:342-1268(+)